MVGGRDYHAENSKQLEIEVSVEYGEGKNKKEYLVTLNVPATYEIIEEESVNYSSNDITIDEENITLSSIQTCRGGKWVKVSDFEDDQLFKLAKTELIENQNDYINERDFEDDNDYDDYDDYEDDDYDDYD